jgi:prefoldin subunit 5
MDEHYLKDFELVDNDEWSFLPQGTRICYLRTDKKFVKGGYIQSISYTNDNEGNQTFFITLNPIVFSSTARPWKIYQNNIEKLWKKRKDNDSIIISTPQEQHVTIEEYNNLKDKIEKYDEYFKNIKADYQRLKDEINSLVKIIRHFHPKNSTQQKSR